MSVRIGIVAGFALFLALAPLAAAEEPTGFREWAWGTTKATIINAASWCQEPNPSRGADDDLLPALSGRRGRHPGHPGLPPRTRAAGSARPLHRAAVLRELLPSRLPDGVCRTGTPPDAPRAPRKGWPPDGDRDRGVPERERAEGHERAPDVAVAERHARHAAGTMREPDARLLRRSHQAAAGRDPEGAGQPDLLTPQREGLTPLFLPSSKPFTTTRRGRPVPRLPGAFGSSRGRLRGYLRRSLHGAYMAC